MKPVPLSGWRVFCSLPESFSLSSIGIMTPKSEVFRFRARYRAAASFRGLSLDGYSQRTTDGYSAFCRTLFVYSAFEYFLKIVGKNLTTIEPSLASHGSPSLIRELWSLDSNHSFYGFLHERVKDERLKSELEAFVLSNSTNIALIAASIRHVFAHGHLSPNAGGSSPRHASEICNLIADFLLKYMGAEFLSMMIRAREEMHKPSIRTA